MSRTAEFTDSSGQQRHLDHPALLYEGLDDFLAVMVPFVSAGIDEGDVGFVAARGDYLPALRAEIGARSNRVHWEDTYRWHPRPASRLRAFHEFLTDELAAGARGFRIAGEPVWPSGSPELTREWQRYESVLNAVLDPFPVALLCLYDMSRLDPSIIATAHQTHPTVHNGANEVESETFTNPEEFLRSWNFDLLPPPHGAVELRVAPDVSTARAFVAGHARRWSLNEDVITDLCIAVGEIITNAMIYAGGAGMWAWMEDSSFVCQIEDRGSGIADPLAGYRPPDEEGENGRGLWIARQLVDLLQVVPTETGTTVRLHMQAR